MVDNVDLNQIPGVAPKLVLKLTRPLNIDVSPYSTQGGYNGNPRLIGPNEIIRLDSTQVSEYKKCMKDPVYFITNYIKIVHVDHGVVPFSLWDYQERMVNTFHRNRYTITKLPRQSGKALALDTPIPTPTGWTTMGKLKVGDMILGAHGLPTKVTMATMVMKNHDCYKVTFNNGETIVADADHLWKVSCSDWRHKEKTLTTRELIPILEKKKKNGSGFYINAAKPIDLPEIELPINPYTFGVWLGDGNKGDARITCHVNDHQEEINQIMAEGYNIKTIRTQNNICRYTISGLYPKLRINRILKNKHIPDIYLRGSISQRLALVQGLMDTDGTCGKDGSCEFYQKKKEIIDSFRELLSSLGIKSKLRSHLDGGQTYYTISFSTILYNVFRLQRKSNRQAKLFGAETLIRHYIETIEKVPSVPVKCIQVDNEDHMFLCGKTMIPTHNSTTVLSYLLYYALFNETVTILILANKGSTARSLLGRLQLAYEHLPRWLKQGIKTWNKGDIEFVNGSKIIAAATTSGSARGETANLLYLDEFAHVVNTQAEQFFTSVYPVISSGKTTKVIITSTPLGLNMFYKLWKDAVDGKSKYVPIEIKWNDVPGRDEKWRDEVIRNTSQQQFDQEFGAEFLGASNTLIAAWKLKALVFENPIRVEGNLQIYNLPEKGHTYAMSVDVSRGQGLDYQAFCVIDVSQIPYRLVAKFRDNKLSPLLYPTTIYTVAKAYNDAYVLVEISDIGQQVADILHYELEYENLVKVTVKVGRGGQQVSGGHVKKIAFGLKTSVATKRMGCANFKTMIETDKLIITDSDTILEMMTFVANKDSFAADAGYHDDCVMSLVNFSWLVAQRYFKDGLTGADLRRQLQHEQMNIVEDDLVPFGVIDNGLDDPDGPIDREDLSEVWVKDRMHHYPFDTTDFIDMDWSGRL